MQENSQISDEKIRFLSKLGYWAFFDLRLQIEDCRLKI